jgi:hypothetical protein
MHVSACFWALFDSDIALLLKGGSACLSQSSAGQKTVPMIALTWEREGYIARDIFPIFEHVHGITGRLPDHRRSPLMAPTRSVSFQLAGDYFLATMVTIEVAGPQDALGAQQEALSVFRRFAQEIGGAAEHFQPFSNYACPFRKPRPTDFDEVSEGTPSVVRLHLGRRVLDGPFLDHLVDQAEILGHVGGHERVALQRVLDILERLTGVPRVYVI